MTYPAQERPFRTAFTRQRLNAKTRGIRWELEFHQWQQIWIESGHWDERGKGSNEFVMSRYGDKGPYSANNVFIQPASDNVSQGRTGKPGGGLKGFKHSPDATKRMSAAWKPRRKLPCPHCSRLIGANNFPRHIRVCENSQK